MAGGINTYSYVEGNPLRYTDPTGEIAFLPILLGAAGGAALDLALQLYDNDGNLSCVDLNQVGVSALLGAAGGGLGSKALRLLGKGGKSIGTNPFKGKSAQEAADMLSKKGFTPKGPNPVDGRGTFVNPKTGRSYHIDSKHPSPKGPHVGVQRSRGARDTMSTRDYPMGGP